MNVQQFQPSRNMTRILSTNRDLQRSLGAARPTERHFQLFKSYVTSRHDDGQMVRMNREEFNSMISNSPIETMLIDYFDQNQNLVGSMLTDMQQDGMSAVYSFFDPTAAHRSLGTYMILDLIQCTVELELPWLYLGYYVAKSQKMRYKSRFKPAEIFRNGSWKLFDKYDDN